MYLATSLALFHLSSCYYLHKNLTHLKVDDMDNTKSMLPRSPEIGKATGSMFKLATKVTGCIIWSGKYPQNRKVIFYLNNNQVVKA